MHQCCSHGSTCLSKQVEQEYLSWDVRLVCPVGHQTSTCCGKKTKLSVVRETGRAGCAGAMPPLVHVHSPTLPRACVYETLYDVGCHLAVGVTSGEVVVLSWQLPAVWRERGVWRGGANGAVLPQPQRTVCWGERDGMAVRHITWQCSSPSVSYHQRLEASVATSPPTHTHTSHLRSHGWYSIRCPGWLLCNCKLHPLLIRFHRTSLYVVFILEQCRGSPVSLVTSTFRVPWTAPYRFLHCPMSHMMVT